MIEHRRLEGRRPEVGTCPSWHRSITANAWRLSTPGEVGITGQPAQPGPRKREG